MLEKFLKDIADAGIEPAEEVFDGSNFVAFCWRDGEVTLDVEKSDGNSVLFTSVFFTSDAFRYTSEQLDEALNTLKGLLDV